MSESEILDLPPPQNLDAERAVIGSVLLQPELFERMGLDPGDFHSGSHRRIWRVCEEIDGIDAITVLDRLKQKDTEREHQDAHAAILAEAAQSVALIEHWRHYRDIVVRTRAKRAAIHFCVEMLQSAYDDTVEPEEWAETLVKRGERMLEWLERKRIT